MKKLVLFFTIALLMSITAFVAFSSNRQTSSAYLEINSYYGTKYNPPTFTEFNALVC